MDYIYHVANMVAIYAILSLSLNLLVGQTGLLSVCHAAFWGIGAYTTAILTLRCGWGWMVSLPIGIMVTGFVALLVGVASLRLRGDCFVMATLGFQVIVYSLLQNWTHLTGGPLGLPGIPAPKFLGYALATPARFLIFSGFWASVALVVVRCLVMSPYGRALKAIREDEPVTWLQGKNTTVFKVSAFVISAALASVGGSVFAAYITYIDPSTFTVMESIFILLLVVIGGAGSVWGPALGAVVLVTLPELLRFVGMPSAIAANMRQILYGAALVACMLWRPQGLIGEYDFGREAKRT